MQIVSEIAEILASAIDGILVIWFFVKYFGIQREIGYWKYTLYLTIFFLNSYFLQENPDIQALLMIVLMHVFATIHLKGRAAAKLIATLIIYILIAFINIGVIQCVAFFARVSIEELIISGSILRILVLCISKLTLLVTLYLAEKFFDKEHVIDKEEGIFLIALYAIFFMVSVLSIRIIVEARLSDVQQVDFMILSLLIFLVNIFLFWMTDKMIKQKRCKLENEILKVQLEQQKNQISYTDQLYQRTRKMRHDIKHYFTTYLQLLKAGDTDLVIREMEKTLRTQLDVKNVFYMDSKMINAVINQKAIICDEKKIPFEVQITGDYKWENEGNIAILLSNLLDNAIEAEVQEGEKKAIQFKMFSYKENVNIIIRNYIVESVLKKNPNLKTTKQDKSIHGIGLESVREIVRQEDGTIDISESENYFTVHILLPAKR